MAKRTVMMTALVTLGLCGSGAPVWAQASPSGSGPGLSGVALSDTGQPMEGVLVRAKAEGGTMAVTVVSGADGKYSFPAGRLAPGNYQINIRAVGFDLKGPGKATVTAGKTTKLDVKLQKTADLGAQLSNGEWYNSWPGTTQQKSVAARCIYCHSLPTIVNSHHDAKEFADVLKRMSNHPQGSSLLNPFDYPNVIMDAEKKTAKKGPVQEGISIGADEGAADVLTDKMTLDTAAYLASINLGTDPKATTWKYPLKTFPRPSGADTHVIMTEYDLPRETIQPHDVRVDAEGIVWYQDFNDAFLGRLDPKTGVVKEWPMPTPKSVDYFKPGGLSVELDSDGNPWMALMRQGALAKFDKKTEKFSTYSLPEGWNPMNATVIMVAPAAEGKVWFARLLQGLPPNAPKINENLPSVHLLDTKTGHIDNYPVFGGVYGLVALPSGNAMVYSLGGGALIEVDAKTGKNTEYQPPTPKSGPRRGQIDTQGRAWFSQFNTGGVGMFDPATKSVKDWRIVDASFGPADPYTMDVDKNGEPWAGGVFSDYVFHLNPATGKTTKYLIPTLDVNIRSINVDRHGPKPVVWVGENHHPTIVKIEPLD